MGIFKRPDTPYVPPPPYAPTMASAVSPPDPAALGAASMVSTGATGLTRKAETRKRTLIGS